jgi:hypothetical protein
MTVGIIEKKQYLRTQFIQNLAEVSGSLVGHQTLKKTKHR